MLYIITYATHNERYFDILKKSYPNIIVLGYGNKWHGFYDKVKATIDFCKDKNDDDLILFVDGFDSIILHTDDIIEKYKSFNTQLVFSKDLNPGLILLKYVQDSFFNTCQSLNLNTGMYIGQPRAIINFWKDIKLDDDDQIYATKKCNEINNNYISIDKYSKLFYNYSIFDSISIDNKKLKIGNEYPNIISAPANGNINDILIKLGYNIHERKMELIMKILYNRILNIINRFKIEIIFLIIIILIIYFRPNEKDRYTICLLLFLELLNYKLLLKHLNISNIYKIIYILINLFHMIINYKISNLFNNAKCNINKLLLLNTIYFLIIILFFIFKKCIFKIIKDLIFGINKSVSKYTQFKYLIDINQKYEEENDNDEANYWIKNNIISLLFIFLLNIYYLI